MIQRNLSICNMYDAKCFWGLLEASHFGIKSPPTNIVFQDAFLDTLFLDLIDVMVHWSILGPFQIPVGAKMGAKIDQVAPQWYPNLRR